MSEDINKLVWFRRADAHRTGLSKHHRGTSSKEAPEAKGGECMMDRKWYRVHRTYLGCSTEEKGQLDSYAQADTSPYISWISEETRRYSMKN